MMYEMRDAMKETLYKRVMERVSREINGTNDLEYALDVSLKSVVDVIMAETGTLWFYDRFDTGRIYPRVVLGGGNLSGITLSPGEGIAGRVIETGEPVIIKDCQADPRWAERVDKKTGFRTLSMICVPLTVEGQTFGSIQVINSKNGELFDDREVSLCKKLAAEISRLIKNQGLLDDYLADSPEINAAKKALTFSDIFIESDANQMELRLKSVPEFASLSSWKQQKVLKLCREIHNCFEKRR